MTLIPYTHWAYVVSDPYLDVRAPADGEEDRA